MEKEPENPVNRVILDLIKTRAAEGTSGPVDLDAVMEAAGGEAAARWRRARAEIQASHDAEARRNAELDSLPLEELRSRTLEALDHAVKLLRDTPIDVTLRGHGWDEDFAQGLADECARLRGHVERGTYQRDWGGAGLGRWVLDQISPLEKDQDNLHDSIHEAQFMLKAYSRRLPI